MRAQVEYFPPLLCKFYFAKYIDGKRKWNVPPSEVVEYRIKAEVLQQINAYKDEKNAGYHSIAFLQ